MQPVHHVWWAFLLLIYIVECEMKIRFQFTQQRRFSFQNQPIFFLNACQFLKIRKIMRAPQSMHWVVSHSFLFHFICEPNTISTYLNKSAIYNFFWLSCLSNSNRIYQRVYLGPEARLLDLMANKDITVSIKKFLLQPYLKANNKPFSPFEPTPIIGDD